MEIPCPHCGSLETLVDRRAADIQPVIPEDIQYDFKKQISDEVNQYLPPKTIFSGSPKPPTEILGEFKTERVSLDVTPPPPSSFPLEFIFPDIGESVGLDPASLRVYLQLSLEFQIILDQAPNYREGVYRWQLLLPDRLQEYGLTEEAWDQISRAGDNDPIIQAHLNRLIKQIFD